MIRRFAIYLTAAVLGAASAFALSALFAVMTVTGSGMEDNVNSGDVVLIYKAAYSGESGGSAEGQVPKVGDVVAVHSDVHSNDGEGSVLIRRVAGAPGDTIEIKDNIFYLNNKPYEEYMTAPALMEPMRKTRLGKHEIFLLNDDRRNSLDSRDEAVGIVESDECIGRVCFK